MRIYTVLMGVLVVGCGSAQSSDQFRLLREELSIVREKMDQSQKQLLANRQQVAQLEGQVRELSRRIQKKPYCKLRLPLGPGVGGLKPSPYKPHSLLSPYRIPLQEDFSKWITRTGPGRYRIKRSGLNRVLGNTTLLARSARIVPSIRNGVPNGFKLYAIRPNCVYSHFGFRNGDTINAINGQAITSPDKAREIYVKVRNASKLTIQFTRRGRPMVHRYTVVN